VFKYLLAGQLFLMQLYLRRTLQGLVIMAAIKAVIQNTVVVRDWFLIFPEFLYLKVWV
jgi:hypothetical protein